MAQTLIIVALCGIGIGVLSSLLGIGGGIVTIPLMRLAFGVDGLVASGTSLFVILPTSISGAIGRIRNRNVIVWLGLCVGAGGVALSPVGSWLATQVGGFWPMIAAAVVIVYTSVNMIRKAIKLALGKSGSPGSSAKEPGSADAAPPDHLDLPRTRQRVVKAVVVGMVAGFLSGFIGVGGGFIVVPLCMWLFKISFKDASGASLIALSMLAIPGIIVHGMYGHVSYLYGIVIAAGSIPGALIGSHLLKRMSDKALRIAFGALLLVVGVTLALNEIA